ncbi:MAG TPA: HipA domain-containing protein, partial [Candidatus Berkiella sp.]|nr:HipA domain-containing protein [Candidatus Berkiella sp.]
KMSDIDKIMNQFFCFRLAMALDIQCVNPQLYPLAKTVGLLVERYDRRIINFHHVQYFHQEDFSQALGYFSSHKYEWDKGPSLKECFAILSKTIVPAIDKLQLVKRVIFNYLIGNTQAHAKNMSLVYYVTAKPVLAPLYNVIATIDDTQMMAMKIGNNYTFESVNMEDWKIFCREIKFSFCLFKQLFKEIIGLLLMQAPKFREELELLKYDVKEIDKIIKSLKDRCGRFQ